MSAGAASTAAQLASSDKFAGVRWWIREIVAISFWVYVIVKLFVFDADRWVIDSYAPSLQPVLSYRAIIFLVALPTLWYLLGNKRFFLSIGYVLLYPFVIVLWKVLKIAFKNWALAFVFLPAIEATFSTFKRRAVTFAFAICSALAISLSTEQLVVIPAMAYLIAYLIIHFMDRLRIAFEPSSVFADIANGIRQASNDRREKIIAEAVAMTVGLPADSPELQAKQLESIKALYALNSIYLIIAETFRSISISRKVNWYLVMALLTTIARTVLIFAFVYWGLERISPGSFSPPVDFGRFLAYSLQTLMTAGISTIHGLNAAAVCLSSCELIAGLFTGIILVFVVLTIVRERFEQDMNQLVNELTSGSRALEAIIPERFAMTIAEAERRLLGCQGIDVNQWRKWRGLGPITSENTSSTVNG